jgi:hypothetical protein
VAADILPGLVGGPKAVNTYIAALGVIGFHLRDSEAVLPSSYLRGSDQESL